MGFRTDDASRVRELIPIISKEVDSLFTLQRLNHSYIHYPFVILFSAPLGAVGGVLAF
ncbi:MAG: hypothetical protein VYA84_13245 [Planctomycetota bacterium]|nr:hypothetical protein [Planctomycetota bacterium]